MRIGVPKEKKEEETRVAVVPKIVSRLIQMGFTVKVERDAGKSANFQDSQFVDCGAEILSKEEVWSCDIVLKINPPDKEELPLLRSKTTLISFIRLAENTDILQNLSRRKISVLAMDAVPRISRAQPLDALSSMANISGYRAVIEASHEFSRCFGGQITAAGKLLPAKVMVIGAGVAGLSAIGTASRLGAVVCAFDSRHEVKEQVESMGATFLDVHVDNKNINSEDHNNDGYANVMSKTFVAAEMSLFEKKAKEVDVIITTASIPGKKAPTLITKNMVRSMSKGSVIVDLAARNGGNCECTVKNSSVNFNGVQIIGYSDLTIRSASQASQLFSANIFNLLKILCPKNNGLININFDDTIIRAVTVILNGKITWPAPPIPVSQVPTPKKIQCSSMSGKTITKEKENKKNFFGYYCVLSAFLLFLIFGSIAPKEFLDHTIVFSLSCVIGYYIVWDVSNALHTPLMSVTNAISGIIAIGALTQIYRGGWIGIIGYTALLIVSINIFGGFAVTQRMLKMFQKKSSKEKK